MRRVLESRAAVVLLAVTTIIALIVAGVGTVQYLGARNDAAHIRADRASVREGQQNAVAFATKVLTNLMTIRQDTIKEDVDKITADIGGDFAGQFTPRRDSYESVVQLNKIVAEGSVVAAGLENESTDDSGKKQYRVVMAVDQQIRNNAGGVGDTAGGGAAAKPSEGAKPTSSAAPSSTPAKPGDNESKDNAAANLPAPGQPEQHTYRIRVTVTPDDSGALKVTGVDFIP